MMHYRWASPLLCLGALGCEGVLGAGSPEPLTDHVPPEITGGEANLSDRFTEANANASIECEESALGASNLRRLNAREVRGSVSALLGVDMDPERLPPDVVNVHGFDTDAEQLRLLDRDAGAYYGTFEEAVATAFAQRTDPFAGCLATDLDCIEGQLRPWLRRAHRRPVDEEVIVDFERLRAAETDPSHGLESATLAMLLSPRFLFQLSSTSEGDAAQVATLGNFQVAERLAYFLWSSPPDDPLLDLAEAGQLLDESVLRAEIARMIADERFDGFVAGFVKSWLGLNQPEDVRKDPALYPTFSPELLDDLILETELFVKSIFRADLPIAELLTSSETFLNQRLAAFYEVPGSFEEEFVPTTMAPGRTGLLEQGSVLAFTGGASAPSPVKRGLWVTRRITCTEPPPPPPDIPTLAVEEVEGQTPKEALAAHRENPACAACHQYIDPLGIALENFDSVGAFRSFYPEGQPVDTTSEWNGIPFDGADALVDLVLNEGRFDACVGEHIGTYVLGHLPQAADNCFLRGAVSRATETNQSFVALLGELFTSELFLKYATKGNNAP